MGTKKRTRKLKKFDIDMLVETGRFRREASVWFYWKEEEYHQALNEFLGGYEPKLPHYNPLVIVASDEERDRFLLQCYYERAKIIRLGIRPLLDEINTIEDAALTLNQKEISDGLVRFMATLSICKADIFGALVG